MLPEAASRLQAKSSPLDEDFSRRIIENVNVWLNVLDDQLNLVYWNATAEKITGYSQEEVLGHALVWEWLYPDEADREFVMSETRAMLAGGKDLENFHTTILCRNRETKTISWHSHGLQDDNGRFYGAITFGSDISDRKRAEEALKKAHDELAVLYEVASVSSESVDLDVILRRSLMRLLPVMKCKKGMVHLWNEASGMLELAAHSGLPPSDIAQLRGVALESGLISQVWSEEAAVMTPNVGLELSRGKGSLPSQLFHAFLGVPLRAKGRIPAS
jgi:PAS domain S-box-containing protein